MEQLENGKTRGGALFGKDPFDLEKTDPEFAALFADFAFDEVTDEVPLENKTRCMAILSALLGCRGVETFRALLPGALGAGLAPVEVKEILYQATAYLGIGKVLPFLRAANEVMREQGVSLPLDAQAAVAADSRAEAGNRIQVEVFGAGMQGFQDSGPAESRHINRWLAANCFGDYYTRRGLTLRQREMITFCFLAAQGGCEAQLTSHAAGNLHIGNDKAFLIAVVSQCLPYIGYPRALNALRCINDAAQSSAI